MNISIELLKDYCEFRNYDLENKIIKGYKLIDNVVYIKWTSIKDENITGEHWASIIELLSFVYMKLIKIN